MPAERLEHVLPFGQTEPLTPACTVTLYPAGHIFGSAQSLLAHTHHGTLLYTGDFKLRPGFSAEPCATPQADVLLMETTFGKPHYIFPPASDVIRDIQQFCVAALQDGDTPVLFGYSLGKSQELLGSLTAARLRSLLTDYQPAAMLWLGDSLHALDGRVAAEAFLADPTLPPPPCLPAVTMSAGRASPPPAWIVTAIFSSRQHGTRRPNRQSGNCRPSPSCDLLVRWVGGRLKLPALVDGPNRLILPAFSPWAGGTPWNALRRAGETL